MVTLHDGASGMVHIDIESFQRGSRMIHVDGNGRPTIEVIWHYLPYKRKTLAELGFVERLISNQDIRWGF